jgi:hypothetical protein
MCRRRGVGSVGVVKQTIINLSNMFRFQQGELAQLVERSLCMRKVTDSISVFSTITFCSRHQFTNTTVAVGAPVVDWILTKRCALILNYHRPYIFELFLVSRQWHSNISNKKWMIGADSHKMNRSIVCACIHVYLSTRFNGLTYYI